MSRLAPPPPPLLASKNAAASSSAALPSPNSLPPPPAPPVVVVAPAPEAGRSGSHILSGSMGGARPQNLLGAKLASPAQQRPGLRRSRSEQSLSQQRAELSALYAAQAIESASPNRRTPVSPSRGRRAVGGDGQQRPLASEGAIVRAQALIRRFLVRRAYLRKLDSRRQHREHVALELLETERQYLEALELGLRVYYEPLKKSADAAAAAAANYAATQGSASLLLAALGGSSSALSPAIPAEKLPVLFSNLAEIISFNRSFLKVLEEHRLRTSPTSLGALFLQWAPFFKLYIPYCSNHARATQCYLELRDEPRAGGWLDQARASGNAETLDSYLIRPVQRIPRYIMLLADMAKHTSVTHADRAVLDKSIAVMQELADQINQSLKHSDKLSQVVQLQGLLGLTDLVMPGRFFIRSGVLQICQLDASALSLFKREVISLWFYLFTDLVLWAERRGEAYSVKGHMLLLQVKLKDVEDVAVCKNAFHLVAPDLTLLISAPTAKDKQEWMEVLEKTAAAHRDTLKRFNITTSPTAALTATIIRYEERADKGERKYTVYVIEVCRPQESRVDWVERRYSEFDTFRQEVERRFPQSAFSKLPQKHFLGNLNKDIIQSRQVMLDNFLQEVLQKPEVCRWDGLLRFLSSRDSAVEMKLQFPHTAHAPWTLFVASSSAAVGDLQRLVSKRYGAPEARASDWDGRRLLAEDKLLDVRVRRLLVASSASGSTVVLSFDLTPARTGRPISPSSPAAISSPVSPGSPASPPLVVVSDSRASSSGVNPFESVSRKPLPVSPRQTESSPAPQVPLPNRSPRLPTKPLPPRPAGVTAVSKEVLGGHRPSGPGTSGPLVPRPERPSASSSGEPP